MQSYDAIVIGAGVIGSSVAYHLARFGAKNVLVLEGPEAYSFKMPVFKDLGSPGMLYCRSYGGTQMLVSEGTVGETLAVPDNEQGDIPMD